MTQALARKYRPKSFDEVVGQPFVVRALTNALERKELHHAHLYTGTRGVGKTTIARIIAKCVNCEQGISPTPCQTCQSCCEIDAGRFPDLFEVDAASRTKVEDTRELLDNVQYLPTKGRYKVYLIDEVHMLSGHSFNALLKTLEEPPEHVIFLLATTDYQRLPATILSRCLQFHLQAMTPEGIVEQIRKILTNEKIQFEDPALHAIAKAARGSMRDALSLLDQAIAYGNGSVLNNDVKAMLGTIEVSFIRDLLQALSDRNAEQLLTTVDQLAQKAVDFTQALSELLTALHELAIKQAIPNFHRIDMKAEISEFATQFSAEEIQLLYQIALLGQRDLPFAPSARSGFEMTLLRMMAFTPNEQAPMQRAVTTPATSAPKKTSTTSSNSSGSSWHEIVAKLDINGATLALAKHCELKKLTETDIHLILDQKQKPFLTEAQKQRLQQAITQHLARPMIVHIELNQTGGNTPADKAKQEKEERFAAAENAIMSDPNVRRMMDNFDATIIKESIVGTEN